MSNASCIIVADDHPLFLDALTGIVETGFPESKVMSAGDLTSAIEALEEASDVDLVLLDLNMPGVQGFSGLIFLRGQYPTIPVVIVSASEDIDTIRRSISLGASGFIPKSSDTDTIKSAMSAVLDGDVWVPDEAALAENDQNDELLEIASRLATLTPQQMRVLIDRKSVV